MVTLIIWSISRFLNLSRSTIVQRGGTGGGRRPPGESSKSKELIMADQKTPKMKILLSETTNQRGTIVGQTRYRNKNGHSAVL
jgi:hypothetical protein